MKNLIKVMFERGKLGDVGDYKEKITDMLKLAGVDDPSDLKFGEVMEIITTYLRDLDTGDRERFGQRFPLADR